MIRAYVSEVLITRRELGMPGDVSSCVGFLCPGNKHAQPHFLVSHGDQSEEMQSFLNLRRFRGERPQWMGLGGHLDVPERLQ